MRCAAPRPQRLSRNLPSRYTAGNNRQQVFFKASDYGLYLELLTTHCHHNGVAVTAWCLMPNHIHLIAVPEAEDSLSRALGQTHSEYALAFNRSEGPSGHLWQSRLFSCPLDRDHLARAMHYVELNSGAGAAGCGRC